MLLIPGCHSCSIREGTYFHRSKQRSCVRIGRWYEELNVLTGLYEGVPWSIRWMWYRRTKLGKLSFSCNEIISSVLVWTNFCKNFNALTHLFNNRVIHVLFKSISSYIWKYGYNSFLGWSCSRYGDTWPSCRFLQYFCSLPRPCIWSHPDGSCFPVKH